MLRHRLLVAIVFLPPFTWMLYYSNPLPFFLLAAVALVLGMLELGQLIEKRGVRFNWWVTMPILLAIIAVSAFPESILPRLSVSFSTAILICLVGSMLLLGLSALVCGYTEHTFPTITASLCSLLLLGGIGVFVYLLRRLPEGSTWLVLLFGFNWIYDAGAYFSGRFFGKHKLAPSISPGKTVEGLVGGLFMNFIVAIPVYYYLLPATLHFSLLGLIAVSMTLGLLSQAGDLVESMIKRWSGAKNSSGLIPGHGGMLDKIDNILFTAPALFIIAWLMLRP